MEAVRRVAGALIGGLEAGTKGRADVAALARRLSGGPPPPTAPATATASRRVAAYRRCRSLPQPAPSWRSPELQYRPLPDSAPRAAAGAPAGAGRRSPPRAAAAPPQLGSPQRDAPQPQSPPRHAGPAGAGAPAPPAGAARGSPTAAGRPPPAAAAPAAESPAAVPPAWGGTDLDLDIELGASGAAAGAPGCEGDLDSLELDTDPDAALARERALRIAAERDRDAALEQRDQAMEQWDELLPQLLAAEKERDEALAACHTADKLREAAERALSTAQGRLRHHEQKAAQQQRSEAVAAAAETAELRSRITALEERNARLTAELAAAQALALPPAEAAPAAAPEGEQQRCAGGCVAALQRAELELDCLLEQNADLVSQLERYAAAEKAKKVLAETGGEPAAPAAS
eukprot:TRINITY_DN5933_c0_g2_i1.p1 TRINITY_DN5933_c0_g2~~TRINITY_DN5933_c0_g2_i1.p1  ORF type:complete len:451 (+),score=131.88 TRINITY_DN5933_c0_g2_i1:147-1355(+)